MRGASMRAEGGPRAAAYAGPVEPHVVGRILTPQTVLVPLTDGTVVLEAGLFRYALAADGTASRIGDLASYAAKMPPMDIHLVGYDVERIAAGEPVPGHGTICGERPRIERCRSAGRSRTTSTFRRTSRATTCDAPSTGRLSWLGLHTGNVMRIGAAGTVETFDMPSADDALARASYTSEETYAHPVIAGKSPSDDDSLDGLRRWVQVGMNVGAPPRPITQIRQIVPRGDSEAWVLVSEGYDTHVLVHMSRPAMAPAAAPLLVGSETDQRNELRNVKEPVTWVAHCPQLFVTLARQRADGSFPADTVWSREKAIGEILRKIAGRSGALAPVSMIVEGRLAGRRVAGVLALRPEPSASEDLVEKAASAVATELSSMTGAMPHITCTAPMLERAAPL